MKQLIVLFFLALSSSGWAQKLEPLIFREKIYDFGEVDEGKGNVDHEFIFTNTSGVAIKILSVQASCGCTTPGWSQNPVLHGKTGFVKASFDPRGRPGHFNKSLTITTDLDPNPIILQIKPCPDGPWQRWFPRLCPNKNSPGSESGRDRKGGNRVRGKTCAVVATLSENWRDLRCPHYSRLRVFPPRC